MYAVSVAVSSGYCDGASHQRRDLYRQSPYDSGIMFLQTKAAAAKWPVKQQQLEQLTQAMASCCPSAAAAERQKQQRGFKDLEVLGLGAPVQRVAGASAGGGALAADDGLGDVELKQVKKRKKSKKLRGQNVPTDLVGVKGTGTSCVGVTEGNHQQQQQHQGSSPAKVVHKKVKKKQKSS